MNKPPIAKITGNVVIPLPTDTAELDGSKSSDDKGIVSYLWTRDEGSPAAGVSAGPGELHRVGMMRRREEAEPNIPGSVLTKGSLVSNLDCPLNPGEPESRDPA